MANLESCKAKRQQTSGQTSAGGKRCVLGKPVSAGFAFLGLASRENGVETDLLG